MDLKVYVSFITVTGLSLAMIVIRLVYGCYGILEISASTTAAITGEQVIFRNTGDNRVVTWNFGDGSPEKKGTEVTHVFDQPRDVQVTASIDGQTQEQIILKIKAPEPKGPRKINPIVEYDNTVKVNEEVEFIDYTSGVDICEWTIRRGNVQVGTGKGKKFKTRFKAADKYTVELRIKGDNLEGEKKFEVVVEKIVTNSPIKEHVVKELDKDELLHIFQEYNSSDVASDRLSQLVSNHMSQPKYRIQVKVNGADSLVTLSDVTNAVLNNQIKVKDVRPIRSQQIIKGFLQYNSIEFDVEEKGD